MISPPVERLGAQSPRLLHVPEFVSSTGSEAVELAAMAGLELDPWQVFVLENALGERADGSWAAFEVGVEVPRQNGKGGILEARELAGLFLLGERLIVHSAHEFPTAEAALERMAVLIESCPDFDRRVKSIKRSHGQEGIYLKGGQALRYRTRTKGGGRGLSADCVVLDEAMHLPDAVLSALFPTLSARANPQLWYTGSAVDQATMDNGLVFARIRARGMAGDDPRLAYFGWSPALNGPDEVDNAIAADPRIWAEANPALGIRITEEYIAGEQRSMSPRGFAVERLGVGDWPAIDADGARLISSVTWDALTTGFERRDGSVALAFDVTPDRSMASVGLAAAGERPLPIELADRRRGTNWVAERVAELTRERDVVAVLADGAGPAASLVPALRDLGVEVTLVTAREHAQACGTFFDAAMEAELTHDGSSDLAAALAGAVTRPLGDAWAWSRRSSSVDISPLVACTLAHWGAATVAANEFVFEVFS